MDVEGGLSAQSALCLLSSYMLESVAVCSSLLLLVGLAVLARKLWILHSKATSYSFEF